MIASNMTALVPMSDLIDRDAERERLTRKIARLEGEIELRWHASSTISRWSNAHRQTLLTRSARGATRPRRRSPGSASSSRGCSSGVQRKRARRGADELEDELDLASYDRRARTAERGRARNDHDVPARRAASEVALVVRRTPNTEASREHARRRPLAASALPWHRSRPRCPAGLPVVQHRRSSRWSSGQRTALWDYSTR